MNEDYTKGMRQLELIWAADGPSFILADCDDTGALRNALKLPKRAAETLIEMLQDAINGEANTTTTRLLLSSEQQEALQRGESVDLGDGLVLRGPVAP